MKIWEAIIYGIFGGFSSLLPISYNGHYTLLRETFNLPPLTIGSGLFIRCGICLGVILAIVFTFRSESQKLGREVLLLTGLRRRKHGEAADKAYVRTLILFGIVLVISLLSFIYITPASRVSKLLIVSGLFAVNGSLVFISSRCVFGEKNEHSILFSDALLIGLSRMVSVFPGLSPLTGSVLVGQLRGLSMEYDLHVAYMLTLAYESVAFFFHLIRAIAFGSLSVSILLPFVVVVVVTACAGYLALQYLRYLLQRQKLGLFAYYCWDVAVIALIIALINA